MICLTSETQLLDVIANTGQRAVGFRRFATLGCSKEQYPAEYPAIVFWNEGANQPLQPSSVDRSQPSGSGKEHTRLRSP